MNRSQSDSKTQPIDSQPTPEVMAEMDWDWCWGWAEWETYVCPACQCCVWADHRPWGPWGQHWPTPCYSFDETCESMGRWKREECAG